MTGSGWRTSWRAKRAPFAGIRDFSSDLKRRDRRLHSFGSMITGFSCTPPSGLNDKSRQLAAKHAVRVGAFLPCRSNDLSSLAGREAKRARELQARRLWRADPSVFFTVSMSQRTPILHPLCALVKKTFGSCRRFSYTKRVRNAAQRATKRQPDSGTATTFQNTKNTGTFNSFRTRVRRSLEID